MLLDQQDRADIAAHVAAGMGGEIKVEDTRRYQTFVEYGLFDDTEPTGSVGSIADIFAQAGLADID